MATNDCEHAQVCKTKSAFTNMCENTNSDSDVFLMKKLYKIYRGGPPLFFTAPHTSLLVSHCKKNARTTNML